jgi:hypothetical protein
MINKSTITRITLLIMVLIIAAFGISSCSQAPNQNSNANTQANTTNKPPKTCDTTMDQSIETTFAASLKADMGLSSQMGQINYFSKGCVLSLHGWANSFKDFKTIYKYASTTADVTQVDISDFWLDKADVTMPEPGTNLCPPGFKACGDFCIPDSEKCSIKGTPMNSATTPKR